MALAYAWNSMVTGVSGTVASAASQRRVQTSLACACTSRKTPPTIRTSSLPGGCMPSRYRPPTRRSTSAMGRLNPSSAPNHRRSRRRASGRPHWRSAGSAGTPGSASTRTAIHRDGLSGCWDGQSPGRSLRYRPKARRDCGRPGGRSVRLRDRPRTSSRQDQRSCCAACRDLRQRPRCQTRPAGC